MAKKKSSTRKPQNRHRPQRHEITNRILIVTEGAVTEPEYFEKLRKFLEPRYQIRLEIHPKPTKGGKGKSKWKSDPVHVVEECIYLQEEDLKKCKKPTTLFTPFRECFAIVDVDQWDNNKDDNSRLDQAIKKAKSAGIHLLISNIKFEVWLIWHKSGLAPNTNSKHLDNQCANNQILIGKNLHPNFPIQNYMEACEITNQRQRVQPNAKGNNPSSAMPRLFEIIGSLAPSNSFHRFNSDSK